MADGVKCSENDRWTFWGSDRTPGLDVDDVAGVMEVFVVDEMLTCKAEKLVQYV